MSDIRFIGTTGETGHRITEGLHEELGQFSVQTVHGSMSGRPRQFAMFKFPEQSGLASSIDKDWDLGSEPAQAWHDCMHDEPEIYIRPRLPRVVNVARGRLSSTRY